MCELSRKDLGYEATEQNSLEGDNCCRQLLEGVSLPCEFHGREACQAAVHRVTQSQTWLMWPSRHPHTGITKFADILFFPFPGNLESRLKERKRKSLSRRLNEEKPSNYWWQCSILWELFLLFSSSLWHHGLQHARLLCLPRVCSNSCRLSWWCYPINSFSAAPFYFRLQSFPASGSISSANEYSGLIFFRIDWFDLLEV